MNEFEKSIIGVARTDQALNKASNIIGAVVFGLTAFGFIGVVWWIRHKNKPAITANGGVAEGSAKPGGSSLSDPATKSRTEKISAITSALFAGDNIPKGLTPAQIEAQKKQILTNINGLSDDELNALYLSFVTTKQASDKLATTGATLTGKSQAERTKILADLTGMSPGRVQSLIDLAMPTMLKAVAGT